MNSGKLGSSHLLFRYRRILFPYFLNTILQNYDVILSFQMIQYHVY
jgi:hypothetical protein